MRRALWIGLLLSTLLLGSGGHAMPPARGALIIIGGGKVPDGARKKALELCRVEKPVVAILPQASGSEDRGKSSVAPWKDAGAAEVVLCDPLDEDARRALERANVIWMPGGSQGRLMRELEAAKLLRVIRGRRSEGAVVAGSSAGAAVMSKQMITGRADLETITAGATEILPGLGLWKQAIVDQHFVARRRNNRLISAVLDHPDLLGVGIDEGTGVVVATDTFDVIGEGNVVVYDARGATVSETEKGQRHGATGLRMHVLKAGMSFRFKDR